MTTSRSTAMPMLRKACYTLMALLPMISIFATGTLFPPSDAEYRPIFQPPGWVFGVVWTYVSLAFGLVSTFTFVKYEDSAWFTLLFYVLILGSLLAWLPVNHSKSYGIGFGILVCATFLAIGYVGYLGNLGASLPTAALLPLPFWLTIATSLNGVIYDHTDGPVAML
jgi:tryptophan-rich sensory protein